MAATRASSSRPDLVLTGRDEVLRTAATRAKVSPSAIPAATVTVAFAGTATPATPEQMARRSSSPSVPAGLLPALPGLVCVPPAPRPPARARALRHPGGPLPPLPPALDGGEVRLAPRPETCPFGQSLYAAPFAVQIYHNLIVISICSRVTSPAERVIVARDVEARAGLTCWASYDCSAACECGRRWPTAAGRRSAPRPRPGPRSSRPCSPRCRPTRLPGRICSALGRGWPDTECCRRMREARRWRGSAQAGRRRIMVHVTAPCTTTAYTEFRRSAKRHILAAPQEWILSAWRGRIPCPVEGQADTSCSTFTFISISERHCGKLVPEFVPDFELTVRYRVCPNLIDN
jgi:hypothetical protein